MAKAATATKNTLFKIFIKTLPFSYLDEHEYIDKYYDMANQRRPVGRRILRARRGAGRTVSAAGHRRDQLASTTT